MIDSVILDINTRHIYLQWHPIEAVALSNRTQGQLLRLVYIYG